MNSLEKEYNTKVFDSYKEWVRTINRALGECSPEVCAEIKQTWKTLEAQTI